MNESGEETDEEPGENGTPKNRRRGKSKLFADLRVALFLGNFSNNIWVVSQCRGRK